MFYVGQIIMICFAFFMASKEVTAVRMMREYVPTPNPFNEPFHFYGFGASVIVAASIFCLQTDVLAFIISPFISSALYWTVFDWKLNHEVYDNYSRIGRTAWVDKNLWQLFGERAERNTVILKITTIILLNLAYAVN